MQSPNRLVRMLLRGRRYMHSGPFEYNVFRIYFILAVEIVLLSRLQAELYVISYALPDKGSHLWFLTHTDKRRCLDQFSRVAWHRKHWYSLWNFIAIIYTSWDIRYTISTSGHRPPSLKHYSPWRRRVFAVALPFSGPQKWRFLLEVRRYLIRIVSSYSSIRSVSRHFDFLWAWLIILRHLRHHKKCAWVSLPVGENRIKQFRSVSEIYRSGLHYKNRAAFRGLNEETTFYAYFKGGLIYGLYAYRCVVIKESMSTLLILTK